MGKASHLLYIRVRVDTHLSFLYALITDETMPITNMKKMHKKVNNNNWWMQVIFINFWCGSIMMIMIRGQWISLRTDNVPLLRGLIQFMKLQTTSVLHTKKTRNLHGSAKGPCNDLWVLAIGIFYVYFREDGAICEVLASLVKLLFLQIT